jgi:hypothetical protein
MSIWKKLLGLGSLVAAPFTFGLSAAAAPFLLKGDGGSDAPKEEKVDLDTLTRKQSDISSRFLTEGADTAKAGEGLVDEGVGGLDKSLKYLLPLIGGDKAAVTSTLAPEYDTILKQYDTARRTISETGPRGGAKGEAIAESTFGQADAMSRLLQVIRREAASEVARVSGMKISAGEGRAGRGLAKEGLGLQSLDQAIAALTAKRGQNLQTYGDIGQGVGSIVASILLKPKES